MSGKPGQHAMVRILSGKEKGRIVELDNNPLTIGLSDACRLKLEPPGVDAGAEILARIIPSAGGYNLTRVAESVTILVNGVPLETERTLSEGDKIAIGSSDALMEFHTGSGPGG